jgi:hypothetical protein
MPAAVRATARGSELRRRRCRSRSGCRGGESVGVELEHVVGRCDQSPFTATGGSAAALEAFDRTVELDLAEHRLDRDLALAVERLALSRSGCSGSAGFHPRSSAASPERCAPSSTASPGINRLSGAEMTMLAVAELRERQIKFAEWYLSRRISLVPIRAPARPHATTASTPSIEHGGPCRREAGSRWACSYSSPVR